MSDSARDLDTALSDAKASIQELADAVAPVTQIDALDKALNRLRETTDELGTSLNGVPDALKAVLDDTTNVVQERLADFSEAFTTDGKELVEESADTLKDTAEAALEQIQQAFEGLTEAVVNTMREALEAVRDDVEDALVEAPRRAVDSLIHEAVERAIEQVATTLLTTQFAMTVSASISPYLPAIAALKYSLDALQEALEIMRAGA